MKYIQYLLIPASIACFNIASATDLPTKSVTLPFNNEQILNS